MLKTLYKFIRDQRGYGTVELMIIIAVTSLLTGSIFTALQGKASDHSGLHGVANSVVEGLKNKAQSR